MIFEQISRNAQAEQKRVILATPEALRECADRLDHAVKAARDGESVLCELTPGITVIFKPDRTSNAYDGIRFGAALEESIAGQEDALNQILIKNGINPQTSGSAIPGGVV